MDNLPKDPKDCFVTRLVDDLLTSPMLVSPFGLAGRLDSEEVAKVRQVMEQKIGNFVGSMNSVPDILSENKSEYKKSRAESDYRYEIRLIDGSDGGPYTWYTDDYTTSVEQPNKVTFTSSTGTWTTINGSYIIIQQHPKAQIVYGCETFD